MNHSAKSSVKVFSESKVHVTLTQCIQSEVFLSG